MSSAMSIAGDDTLNSLYPGATDPFDWSECVCSLFFLKNDSTAWHVAPSHRRSNHQESTSTPTPSNRPSGIIVERLQSLVMSSPSGHDQNDPEVETFSISSSPPPTVRKSKIRKPKRVVSPSRHHPATVPVCIAYYSSLMTSAEMLAKDRLNRLRVKVRMTVHLHMA